jgi:hypothetical protein
MQTNIPLLLNIFVFRIVLRFTETLHESPKSSPMPVSFRPHLSSHICTQPIDGPFPQKVSTCSVIIKIVCTLDPFTLVDMSFMLHLSIHKNLSISVTSVAVMLENSLVFLVES